MHSLAPPFLDRLTFSTAEVATLTSLAESRGRQGLHLQQPPGVLDSLRTRATVESAASSARMAGIPVSRERIEALVRRTTQPRNPGEQEVAGYRDALALIHESNQHLPFTVNVLLELHGLLYRHHPGGGGRFDAKAGAYTQAALEALTQAFEEAVDRGLHPLIGIPLAVLDLLSAHPFEDGNGRVARLCTQLLLRRHGFAFGEYVSLDRLFEGSFVACQDAFRTGSDGGQDGAPDVHPWLHGFWDVLERAKREFEATLSARGTVNKSDLVRSAVLRRVGPFTSTEIERDCPGVSPELVRFVMRQLRDEGGIALQRRGRGAPWVRRSPEEAR